VVHDRRGRYVQTVGAVARLASRSGEQVPLLHPGASARQRSLTLDKGWNLALAGERLHPYSRYLLSVTTEDGVERTVHFRAGVRENGVDLVFDRLLRYFVATDAPNVSVVATDENGRSFPLKLRKLGGSPAVDLSGLPLGLYKLCASSGGEPTQYAAASACLHSIRVGTMAAAYITVGSFTVSGANVQVVVSVRGPLLGARARIEIASMFRCGSAWCGGWSQDKRLKLSLRARQTLRVRAPSRPGSADFKLTIPAFTRDGVAYRAIEISRSRRF
jgi:hypothetical protein